MFKLIYKTIINTLLLFTCLSITHVGKTIDPEVKPFFNKFMSILKECQLRVDETTLRMEVNNYVSSKFVALCYMDDNFIEIKKAAWDRSTDLIKEQTIFHELGHCLLRQQHDEQYLNIMNSKGFIDREEYFANYDYYIRKLFIGCKKDLATKFIYEE
jgi:hypothetical protein